MPTYTSRPFLFILNKFLLSVAYRTSLTDHRDLNLSRISHLILNLLSDLSGQVLGVLIVNLISANDYAQLSTRLDSVSLDATRIRSSQ